MYASNRNEDRNIAKLLNRRWWIRYSTAKDNPSQNSRSWRRRRKLRTRGESNKTFPRTTKGILFYFTSFQEQRSTITRKGSHSLEEFSQKLTKWPHQRPKKNTTNRNSPLQIWEQNSTSTTRRRNLINFPSARNNEVTFTAPHQTPSSRNQTKRKTAQIIRWKKQGCSSRTPPSHLHLHQDERTKGKHAFAIVGRRRRRKANARTGASALRRRKRGTQSTLLNWPLRSTRFLDLSVSALQLGCQNLCVSWNRNCPVCSDSVELVCLAGEIWPL